jgi:hypothetical protein
MRFLVSLPLFAIGGVLGLYGALALTFNEGNGSTYVSLMGRHVDAHLVGIVCLVLGLAAIAAGAAVVRRDRLRS